MNKVEKWLQEKGYQNAGLRVDINQRIDLYLSDVIGEYESEVLNKECEHPWSSVLGDGEMQPAKCLKCGETL